ncbi:MAG TPA: signal recognition particle-docking protein FtsY [bacterium]|nr:signal recognition particle-docking protein FtsY [bacterium]HPG44173.1 signal recognition particle-docking protein FtsY [bacterium]HPM96540.1 signal recognition particle-docking protein FtsY [bacterium]
MLSVLSKLQKGLAKTRSDLVGGIARTLTRSPKIDEAALEELEEVLLSSDVGFETAEELIEQLRSKDRSGLTTTDSVVEIFKAHLIELLDSTVQPPRPLPVPPQVISIIGVNGSGKTTIIGKLAYRLTREKKKVLLAAADTFRAGAIDQLAVWAKRAEADLVSSITGSDPAAVAFDAVRAAKNRQHDILIIDTAGRLHTKTNLMEELKKIHRVIQREIADAPHEVYLVIDATTGQNGLTQARQFAEAAQVTGIILTKLDGTAKGGIVLAITRELGLPIRYVGVGETIDDLELFDASQFVEALFR